ncbi:hypothetical protein CP985_03210 [Malaciobacter mytili LMG 24559]|uniref:Lipoprotein n=1 Tax=Malaciobacter mytili LMG 24559 TaxID=1032238 RepID=A0AAX2AHD5_9BACT|nr:hypothetical protein [Malaciobacter mytili]AXH16367.1 putative membrane protein [Malaciobacter mytili LMG 24559]RXK16432.1 hypothetical protein CP985_03210 [Malaciobacter mytili LMG 24559]
MKRYISILIISLLIFVLNGCAVKKTDSIPTKVVKHTINTPAYVVIAIDVTTDLLLMGTIIGGAKLLGIEPKKDEKKNISITDEVIKK